MTTIHWVHAGPDALFGLNHLQGCDATVRVWTREGRLAGTLALRTVSGVALLYGLFTLYGAGGEALMWGLGLLLLAIPVYFAVRRGVA